MRLGCCAIRDDGEVVRPGGQVEGVIDIKMPRRLYGEDVQRELQRHREMLDLGAARVCDYAPR